MTYGKIDYDMQGRPICAICGKGFDRLGFHVWKTHKMEAIEYKKMFGLDTKKGLTSQKSRLKSRNAVLKNYDKVVTQNLLKNGENTRFHKGHKGRTKDKVSEQTKNRLQRHIKRINPIFNKD